MWGTACFSSFPQASSLKAQASPLKPLPCPPNPTTPFGLPRHPVPLTCLRLRRQVSAPHSPPNPIFPSVISVLKRKFPSAPPAHHSTYSAPPPSTACSDWFRATTLSRKNPAAPPTPSSATAHAATPTTASRRPHSATIVRTRPQMTTMIRERTTMRPASAKRISLKWPATSGTRTARMSRPASTAGGCSTRPSNPLPRWGRVASPRAGRGTPPAREHHAPSLALGARLSPHSTGFIAAIVSEFGFERGPGPMRMNGRSGFVVERATHGSASTRTGSETFHDCPSRTNRW